MTMVEKDPGDIAAQAQNAALLLLSRAERRRIPMFLGIGAQKAGTTWLHQNLGHHPDLFLPQTKELHFLDQYFNRGLCYYLSQFRGGEAKVRGEITPEYMGAESHKVSWMKTLNPHMRLILLIREPVARTWSAAAYFLRNKKQTNILDVPDNELHELFRQDFIKNRGRYITGIKRWTTHFGSEQLFIAFYDEISTEPERLLSGVFRHIGVDPDVDMSDYPLRRVVNPGPRTEIPDIHKQFLAEMYADELSGLRNRFKTSGIPWLSGGGSNG